MAAFVARLPEPPVIVGHSMGGLIAQQLAAQGLARALVLLAPGAPWGVLPSTEDEMTLAKGLMMASPFWDKALNPSFEVAKGDSLASLDPAAQRRIFEMFSPESGLALFELFFWMFDMQRTTAVETGKVTCPVWSCPGRRIRSSPRSPAARWRSSIAHGTFEEAPAAAISSSWRRGQRSSPSVAPIGWPKLPPMTRRWCRRQRSERYDRLRGAKGAASMR